jgi:AcrR family transcriptional regulator
MQIASRQASNRPGTATKNKGQARLASIIDAARSVFVRAGYAGFSMRRVAQEAGITIGNLSYYYRTKKDLLRDLTDHVVDGYLAEFDRIRRRPDLTPREQFEGIVGFWIDDLANPATTAFFPELWALGNHDPYIAGLVDDLYIKARRPLVELMPLINPALAQRDVERIALYMCAAMEGLTVFAGHGKPWTGQLPELRALSVATFMKLIENPVARSK